MRIHPTMRTSTMSRLTVPFLLLSCAAATACDAPLVEPDGGACTAGREGCACIEGSLCQGGLVCEMGLCRGVDEIEVEVTDANARSCELVLVETETEVLGIDFSTGTIGTHVHESPRTAVTFTRNEDTPFGARSVIVRRTEGVGGSLAVRRARCFDRDGNALAGEPLRLVE